MISPDILARYAADAARAVEGVDDLVPSQLHRIAACASLDDRIELHVRRRVGRVDPEVGREVRQRVADYLRSMANARRDASTSSSTRSAAP